VGDELIARDGLDGLGCARRVESVRMRAEELVHHGAHGDVFGVVLLGLDAREGELPDALQFVFGECGFAQAVGEKGHDSLGIR